MESTASNASTRLPLFLTTLSLKFLFLGHVTLGSWIMIDGYGGVGYLFHTTILTLLILYGIHFRESPEPLVLAICVEILAFLFDLLLLMFHTYYFCLGILLVVVHMIFRVLSAIVLHKEHRLRGGPLIHTALRGIIVENSSQYDDIYEDQRPQPHIAVPRHATDMGHR